MTRSWCGIFTFGSRALSSSPAVCNFNRLTCSRTRHSGWNRILKLPNQVLTYSDYSDHVRVLRETFIRNSSHKVSQADVDKTRTQFCIISEICGTNLQDEIIQIVAIDVPGFVFIFVSLNLWLHVKFFFCAQRESEQNSVHSDSQKIPRCLIPNSTCTIFSTRTTPIKLSRKVETNVCIQATSTNCRLRCTQSPQWCCGCRTDPWQIHPNTWRAPASWSWRQSFWRMRWWQSVEDKQQLLHIGTQQKSPVNYSVSNVQRSHPPPHVHTYIVHYLCTRLCDSDAKIPVICWLIQLREAPTTIYFADAMVNFLGSQSSKVKLKIEYDSKFYL